MAARTISELASCDARRDQQPSSSKWRPSSSSVARDAYQTPLERQPLEKQHPSGKRLLKKRAENSLFRPNLQRNSLVNIPATARHSSRVDTTSAHIHHAHHSSISRAAPNKAYVPSTFIASSTSSRLTLSSSVPASRTSHLGSASSRERVASLQSASTMEQEVIDLTLDDSDDDLLARNVLDPNNTRFNDLHAHPGTSRRHPSSTRSPPMTLDQSLFTPPPPLRRRPARLVMNYIAVPPFPKGLTKADYQPISDRPITPPAESIVASILRDSSVAKSSATDVPPRTPQMWKGKECERDTVSSPKEYRRCALASGIDIPSLPFDALYQLTKIPLQDVDTYPQLTAVDLATNSRFQFVHAWRTRASKLRKAELECMEMFGLRGAEGIWAQVPDTLLPTPRMPGTAGYVLREELLPWELVQPDSLPQGEKIDHTSDELVSPVETRSIVAPDANDSSTPGDALPTTSIVSDRALPGPLSSQGFSSTTVDSEHDMNQYFSGLNDSPNKTASPRPDPAPTHTIRPHLLHSSAQTQTSPLGLDLPLLDHDLRLAHTSDGDCFLGVPPSPPPAETMAPAHAPISPFQPFNYLPASPSNIFGGEAPLIRAWSFERGEGLVPGNNDLPADNHVSPIVLDTINPSLLGPEKPPTTPPILPVMAPKRHPKLPEPVIYVRRPIDSSSLPLSSSKRPVQIKYRDAENSPATPSTQSGPKELSSTLLENTAELSSDDQDVSLRSKRCSVPSRKLREHETASSSDSDYAPDSSHPRPKLKLKLSHKSKQSSGKDKESAADHQGTPQMSFCHQCRNKTARPKMMCSNVVREHVCGKRFCNRCILHRYPEITFDEHSAGFLCPVCTNTCNCSVCSRNRGEEYVSMRLGGLAASIFKTNVTLVRDVGAPLPRADSLRLQRSASDTMTPTPTPEPDALPQPQFWAHVYGMEGEHMGSAFMTRKHLEQLQHMPESASQAPPKNRDKPTRVVRKKKPAPEKPRGPRVFIGRPLASWKVRAVRDLEPSADVGNESDVVPGSSRRRPRWFIGDRAPLHEPYGRMPGTTSQHTRLTCASSAGLDSDGSLMPLSDPEPDLEGDYRWPQPAVGECCTWEPGLVVSGPFVGEVPGALVPADHVTMGAVAQPGPVGASLNPGSGSEVAMDVHSVGAGDGQLKATGLVPGLSDEDTMRAINLALGALAVDPLPSFPQDGAQPTQASLIS